MEEVASETTVDRRAWSTALVVFRALTIIVPCVALFLAVEFTGKQNTKDIEEIKTTLATLVSAPLSVQQNTKDIEELKAGRTAMYSKMSDTFTALDNRITSVDLKLNSISVNQAQIGQSVQDIKDGLREDRSRRVSR
jgi:septation ring formation regulator EzrA